MSKVNELMQEMASASSESANEVETQAGAPEKDTNDSIAESHEVSSSENNACETPSNATPNPEPESKSSANASKKQYTPEEKAQYAFRKRLDRANRKYEAQIAELKKQIELLSKPQTKAKTRADFANDEEYVRDYFGNMISDAFTKKEEEYRKREEMANAQAQVMESFANQVTRDFGSIEEYNTVVENSLESGLGELIETNPIVKDFIKQSDCSAKVLYALATDQNAVNRIFGSKTEWDMFYNLKRLEESLEPKALGQNKPAQTAQASTNTAPRPIGKVGSQGGQTNENWDDKSWLLSQLRHR